jgi:hypothetical protein
METEQNWIGAMMVASNPTNSETVSSGQTTGWLRMGATGPSPGVWTSYSVSGSSSPPSIPYWVTASMPSAEPGVTLVRFYCGY